MSAWLEQFLVRYPELALFLVIAAGYWIGSFKIGAFSLGLVAAVQERSGSPVAVLGYTPAYPIANILLTTWGTIIVLVVAG